MMDSKYTKLAERKQWKKLTKIAEGKNIDDIIQVAAACGLGRDEDPYNILVDLTAHKEQAVQLAAINGLGECRHSIESQITRLMWLSERNSGNTEMTGAISRAVAKLRAAKK